jgi:AcrR family transcriptional regulator
VLAEEGYARVSMRKIAARIEYSPTTIYRFFSDKEDLLRAVVGQAYGELSTRFERAKSAAGDRPLGVLRALLREYAVYCLERPDMYRLLADLASFELEDGAMYERVGSSRVRVFQSWLACIADAASAGAVGATDSVRVFLFVWDSISGYIGNRIGHPAVGRKPLREDLEEVLDLILRAIARDVVGEGRRP